MSQNVLCGGGLAIAIGVMACRAGDPKYMVLAFARILPAVCQEIWKSRLVVWATGPRLPQEYSENILVETKEPYNPGSLPFAARSPTHTPEFICSFAPPQQQIWPEAILQNSENSTHRLGNMYSRMLWWHGLQQYLRKP